MGEEEEEHVDGAGIRFSFDELRIMTNEFSDDNILVKTQNFDLFRGIITPQSESAVIEHVTIKIWHSSDKLARFRKEITILGQPRLINCPNIATLMGYCAEGEHVATVYKLHSVDTLDNLLDKDEYPWRDRMIAALGIARIFCFIDVKRTSHLIHSTLPSYIILDQESNPVLCDARGLISGVGLPDEVDKDSSVGNKDATAGKMKRNGIFAFGVLLLRLIRGRRNDIEDTGTKLPRGFPIPSVLSYAPFRSQKFFNEHDYSEVFSLVNQCLAYDEKCLTISQMVQKLENLVLFSLPVRTSCSKVAVKGHTLIYFTYSDLCELTDNFSLENLFAITQFGEAYRGRIQQGWKEVAAQNIIVKMWGEVNFSRSGRDSKKSTLVDDICRLRDEVLLLTRDSMIDNPCIVKLLGYCYEDKKVGAVYSVQPWYTLESLFDDEWFEWKNRIAAALELARTLVLFHCKEQQYVVSNLSGAHIMINQDKTPILYDFSMIHGQVLSGERAVRSFHLLCSIDYLDPYYPQTGLVVPQSDIYAFGALLMSLICKRDMRSVITSFLYRHVEDRYKSESSLVHGSFTSHPSFDHKDGCKLTALAMACLEKDNLLSRPSASDIVQQLESLSLFSESLFSTDVKAKVIDSCSIREKNPSLWNDFRLFIKLCISRDKLKEWKRRSFFGSRSGKAGAMSPHALAKQKQIIERPGILRPSIYEKTPEEICYRIQLIDESLKREIEHDERQRALQRNKVKRRQSNFVKQLGTLHPC
ncbi:uncharacterized protein LOC141647362 isoform X2 [Silene latifolia]|uniref:uncharacterized protein LOC141647362 isoform X2 n=1 Tax=Silene latifolia TaxID=37657 RepID=UPI003D77EA99